MKLRMRCKVNKYLLTYVKRTHYSSMLTNTMANTRAQTFVRAVLLLLVLKHAFQITGIVNTGYLSFYENTLHKLISHLHVDTVALDAMLRNCLWP